MLHHAIKDGLPGLSSDPVQAMGMEFSVQDWLVAKWMRQAGGDKIQVRQKLELARQVPHQWVRVHIARIALAEFIARFGLTEAKVWGDRFVEVDSKLGAMLASDEFKQGLFSVQNPAADLLVQLLDVTADATVWDACAAPGGKSALILERVPSAKLVASDIDEKRLASLDDLTVRLGLPAFETLVCDATAPNHGRRFARILLDAPCSNLGVMSRRPEVPMRLDRKSFEQTYAKQARILQASAQCLELGGILVYATCSPEPEETTGVIQDFLQKNPNFVLEDAANFVAANFVKDSCIQAFNAELGFDGFFGARLKRIS
jgi:16S rRNA (cytosine967-C5)-methyltransferase